MAIKNFKVAKGLMILDDPASCGNARGLIYGDMIPGGNTEPQEDDAGIGMIYVNTTNGDIYKKVADSDPSVPTDWEIVGADAGVTVSPVTSTETIDCIMVDFVKGAEWEVAVEDVAAPENKIFYKVFAGHNGTDAADATSTDFTAFAHLCFGTEPQHGLDVSLTGAGAAQQMCVTVGSGLAAGVSVTVRRTDIK